jgi:hypothetical protein
VSAQGPDPRDRSFSQWSVACDPGAATVAALIDASREAGWEIAAVAPETRTLESVFEELQRERARELLAGEVNTAAAPSAEGAAS